MFRLVIAVAAVAFAPGAASAQQYFMRAHLVRQAEPVDDHFYRWSQPIDIPNGGNGPCVAGFRTIRYVTQCYDQTADAIVPHSKCPAPTPAPLPDLVLACTLSCVNPVAYRKPVEEGVPLGIATSPSAAATLCRKHPAQHGVCYRDTATNQVTYTYTDALPLVTTRQQDTATYCTAR
jgi:hypothetical protein